MIWKPEASSEIPESYVKIDSFIMAQNHRCWSLFWISTDFVISFKGEFLKKNNNFPL